MAGWGRSRRLLLLVVGQAALAASVLVLLVVWRFKGLGTAANGGQLVGVVLAVPALSVGLSAWWWRERHRDVASVQVVEDATKVLARVVAGQWENEAELRSLEDPDPMPVRWLLSTNPDLADMAGQAAAAGWDASSSDIEDLAVQFQALDRGRLVILGSPGSGKTTLAVQLLRELIRIRTPSDPVPVLVSAASWNTATHRGVWEWMASQLTLTYPALKAAALGPDPCAFLVAGPDPLVLPVIDGLDEIPLPARVAIVEALNRSLGRGRLILTCRTTDWEDIAAAADTVLGGAAVIEPAQLTPAAAADYLQRCLRRPPSPAWRHLLDHLTAQDRTPASPLAQVCSTPLGLWLVRTVYRPPATVGTPAPDPTPLTDPAAYPAGDRLRAHLFDQLIPSLVRQRPPTTDPLHLFRPRRGHRPDDVTRWLTWIAQHLTHPRAPNGQPRTRDLAWWHIARSTIPAARLQAVNLLITTAVGLIAGLIAGLTEEIGFGLIIGILGVLGGGLTAGLGSSSWLNDQPGYANLALRNRKRDLRRALTNGLTSGLTSGLAGGLAGVLAGVLADGLDTFAFALSLASMGGVGLVGGLVAGLINWSEAPVSAGSVSTPASSLHSDRALILLRTLAFGLAVGLAFGLAFGLTVGLAFGLAGGSAFGLLGGLVLGLAGGEHHAWWCYLVATTHLSRSGALPRDLMGFLDDAHRLGLLRAVGSVYQFRHADFQDHLAQKNPTTRLNLAGKSAGAKTAR